jgi:hypothetical protein
MIKEILTTYWSQSVLIILGIAYFIKRIFDSKSKKLEIKYSLFQQNRIIAVNTFFSNYAKVEFMWHQIPYWDILEHKIRANQIDEIVWPPLYALKQSLFELKVYFPEVDHKHFEKLYNNFLSLNKILLDANIDYSESKNIIQKSNAFTAKRDKTFRENNTIIEDLTTIVRSSYMK